MGVSFLEELIGLIHIQKFTHYLLETEVRHGCHGFFHKTFCEFCENKPTPFQVQAQATVWLSPFDFVQHGYLCVGVVLKTASTTSCSLYNTGWVI